MDTATHQVSTEWFDISVETFTFGHVFGPIRPSIHTYVVESVTAVFKKMSSKV